MTDVRQTSSRPLFRIARQVPVRITDAVARRVVPPPREAWDEKRWTRTQKGDHVTFSGEYRVLERQSGRWREFAGQIRQHGRRIVAYIADPPSELRDHPHGACLQLSSPPWFLLHWERRPKTADDALIYMERLLDEAFNGVE